MSEGLKGKKMVVSAARKKEEFSRHELVPDILSAFPGQTLTVKYESAIVNLGHTLTPSMVANPPTIVDWEPDTHGLYTLMMIDPDAPARYDPKYRSVLHWLVINIPGNDWDKGETLAEYIGAGPTKDSGFHRYLFLVVKQLNREIADMDIGVRNDSALGRRNFNLADFLMKHELSQPIAANFFQAKWDDAVVLPMEKSAKEKEHPHHGRPRTISIDHSGAEV